jgi:hypothetical protein
MTETNGKIMRLKMLLKPHLIRLLCLAFILSFLLPYVDVRGCSDKKMQYFHGYELIFKGYGGIIYLLPICIFAFILIASFVKTRPLQSFSAFGAGLNALGAGLSGLVILFMPHLQFIFDEVSYRIGYLLGLVCVAGVFAEGIAISLRNLRDLRKERPPKPVDGYSPALMRYHYGVIIFSILLVPFYFFIMRGEIAFPVLILLVLSAPFVLLQNIVIEAARRGERWTRRWAVAVFFLALAALALLVLSVI